jgi:hypothetical protein
VTSACGLSHSFGVVSRYGVCRTFGVSRKTDYKILERYKEHGPRLERLNRHLDWRRNAAQQEIFY